MRSIPISSQYTPVAPQEGNGEMGLLQLLGTLRRGKWRIAIYVTIAILIGGYYVFRMATPMYTATSVISLQNRTVGQTADLASPVAALGGDFYTINTELETLRSRQLIGKLVDRLNLVEDPVFNYALRPPQDGFSPKAAVMGAITTVLRTIFPPEERTEPVIAPTEEQIRAETRERVINAVLGAVNASNLRSTYVLNITVTTDNPTASQTVANALAEVYADDQIDVKIDATRDAIDWLTTRVNAQKVELDKAENAVKDFNSGTNLVGPEGLEALNRQLKDRRDRVEDTRARAVALETRAEELAAVKLAGDPARMAEAADEPGLKQILPRLGTAGAREAFDTRFDQIVERARFEAERTRGQAAALEGSVRDLEVQVGEQSEDLLKLQELERDAAATRQLYEYLLTRLKETSAQAGEDQTADSRILSYAVRPKVPSSPRTGMTLMAAAFFGFAVGCALVIIREMRQTGFRSAQEVEQATGFSVLAQIPKAPFTKRRRILNYVATKTTSSLVEAVRNLRTSVLLSNMDNPPQIIMMTSSLPGEGKTTQSIALSHSFAGMGKKVLLIEGDIRRRTFREYFNAKGRAGLITAVAGETPLDEIVIHSQTLGVDVLLGEKSTANAADFFSSERFKAFLEELRRHYDVIIIDTPPVLVVPDARVIGRMVDAVIYAVHWNRTTRAQLEEGLGSLQTVGVKVSGLSLSQINLREAQNYGGKYSELYSAYGRKYYNN